ncbi:MAG TPA: phosphate ABC transporter substrate-binding protein [Myxococcota bacterium]|nr:phosphate ABC transporter substrate-binding protein [Myxococcota bacterium]
MQRPRLAAILIAASGLVPLCAWGQPVAIEAGIPPYAVTSGVSGNLSSIGSDTLNDTMTLWAEGFHTRYPNVKVQIEGKGSSTAPPALIDGTAQLGPMSREMKPTEIDAFEKKFGYKPTAYRVAVDALAVWVNKDNPLTQATLPQIDAIFSKTRRCGMPAAIDDWSQIGLGGVFKGRRISLYGRNSASGTYGYFKEHALCNGDYRDEVKEQPGSASVVQGVTEDTFAIGYSGMGYRTSGVKSLELAKAEGQPYVAADAAGVYSGRYPLARFLFVYVNQKPGQAPDPLVREFLRFVLSHDGQEVVVKAGFLPITQAIDGEERKKLGS